MTDLEDFRQVVREEIRRDSIGARCPHCRGGEQGITLEQIDEMADEDEECIWNCPHCTFSAPIEIFDPLHPENTP